MMKSENPWKNMDRLTQRRANPTTPHNIFWIRDTDGKYGFWISAASVANFKEEAIKLKGITITKSLKSDGGDLFLLLESNEDWEVFRSLCEDLIRVTVKYTDEEKMMSVIDVRLKKWQQMLKSAGRKTLTVEQQMGLLGELLCLKEILVPALGVTGAVQSWTGPELDKQDFLLDDTVIEVKSSKTSRGEFAMISSLGQLSSNKDKFFLVFYNLSPSSNGVTLEEYINDMKSELFYDAPSILEAFESKLIQYGYIAELNPELESFQVDKRKTFQVSESFPRLIPSQVDQRIVTVNYQLDLSRLAAFEVEYYKTLKEELL